VLLISVSPGPAIGANERHDLFHALKLKVSLLETNSFTPRNQWFQAMKLF